MLGICIVHPLPSCLDCNQLKSLAMNSIIWKTIAIFRHLLCMYVRTWQARIRKKKREEEQAKAAKVEHRWVVFGDVGIGEQRTWSFGQRIRMVSDLLRLCRYCMSLGSFQSSRMILLRSHFPRAPPPCRIHMNRRCKTRPTWCSSLHVSQQT